MKKIILTLLLVSISLLAQMKNEYLTKALLDSKIPIVDIRTVGEWKETGIIKDSIPIEFFNQRGAYNIKEFMAQLNAKVDTTKPFALICRTGSRTKMVAAYLCDTYNYKVTNITGGITMPHIKQKDLKLVMYK